MSQTTVELLTDGKIVIADLASDLQKGFVPIGGIIMWYGSTGSIPTGFSLCNGATVNGYATPDLRDRFVVGAGSAYAVNATGGAASVTLTTDQMPSHNHSASSSASVDRDYTFSPRSAGAASGGSNKVEGLNNQTPTVSVTTTIGNAGGGQSHENRPPYYALCYIMRTS